MNSRGRFRYWPELGCVVLGAVLGLGLCALLIWLGAW